MRDGKDVMISAPSDAKLLDAIEKLIDKEIPRADAPEVALEEKPQRSRSRKRREDEAGNSDAAPKRRTRTNSADDAAPADAISAIETAPVADEAPSEAPKRARVRGKRGGDDRGPKVVGMGDHMPSFIAMSFEERKAG